ncbi:outer membrane protein, adhesin transport system [Magnetospirillum fulvum]|uniref:Outer membrane protein, adhesin transport system n=1 Tax=Magnetospirillum fulvum TaxID=1082 RepID=A0A1H6H392_MAGFU|nr:outer membrane protein, adhesin transport system [Magnetospirillum fulvum]
MALGRGAKWGAEVFVRGLLKQRSFGEMTVGAVLVFAVAAPLHAQDAASEPLLPLPVPRGQVESDESPVRARGGLEMPPSLAERGRPAAKSAESDPAAAAPPPDSAAKGAGEPPLAPEGIDRGTMRAVLLRKLGGGDVLTLDPDPNNPPTVTEPLDMGEAVAFALKNNFEIKAARAKAQGSRWEFFGSIGQYLPRLEYERQTGSQRSSPGSYHIIKDSTDTTQNPLVDVSKHHTWTRTYSVKQPLIDLSIVADILNRDQVHDAASADETATRERVALDTITCFLRLVRSRLTIGFATSYKSNLDRLGERMKVRVSGGGSSGVELDRINARSTSARSAMIEAGAEYQAALVEFRRLTNVTPIKLSLPARLMPDVPGQVEEVLMRALRMNPEYQVAQLKADAALTATWKQMTAFLPKLSMQMTDSRTFNAGGVSQEDPMMTDPSPVYPYVNDRRLMLVFNWTLNGGSDIGQSLANAAYARQASYVASDTRLRLEESVRTSFSALNAANGLVDSTNRALNANAKVATAFDEQFLNGNRQLLDLLDAYERLYQSQNELSRLLISEATASFLVRRQMGELVEAIVVRTKE